MGSIERLYRVCTVLLQTVRLWQSLYKDILESFLYGYVELETREDLYIDAFEINNLKKRPAVVFKQFTARQVHVNVKTLLASYNMLSASR